MSIPIEHVYVPRPIAVAVARACGGVPLPVLMATTFRKKFYTFVLPFDSFEANHARVPEEQ